MSCDKLTADIVSVPAPWGIVLLIINVLLPGIGSIINSLMADKVRVTTLVVGILQLVLAGFIVGWIWSIIWGVLIFKKQA